MFAETVDDLIARFRSEVDDEVSSAGGDEDKLWKDADVLAYITEAADKVARVTHILTESIDIAITAYNSTLTLPARVVEVSDFGRLVSAKSMVKKANANELLQCDLFDNTGTPRRMVGDFAANTLELFPSPIASDTLRLPCFVTISEPLALGDDLPFTHAEDQRLMLTYMKHLAYMKHDSEAYDLQRSKEYGDNFEADALRRAGAIRNLRRRPGTVRMNW